MREFSKEQRKVRSLVKRAWLYLYMSQVAIMKRLGIFLLTPWIRCESIAGLPPAFNLPISIYRYTLQWREALWEWCDLPKNTTWCLNLKASKITLRPPSCLVKLVMFGIVYLMTLVFIFDQPSWVWLEIFFPKGTDSYITHYLSPVSSCRSFQLNTPKGTAKASALLRLNTLRDTEKALFSP